MLFIIVVIIYYYFCFMLFFALVLSNCGFPVHFPCDSERASGSRCNKYSLMLIYMFQRTESITAQINICQAFYSIIIYFNHCVHSSSKGERKERKRLLAQLLNYGKIYNIPSTIYVHGIALFILTLFYFKY